MAQEKTLFPIIVPRDYFARGNWPGPYRLLRHPALAVTWVELADQLMMTYVTFDRCREIEAAGIPIHQQAMENLRRASIPLFTHGKEEDCQLIFGVCMHEDGLGTSRLLLLDDIAARYPDGALLGIPERSCGIVAPIGIAPGELQVVEGLVDRCCRDGTNPMLAGLHEPRMFELDDA